MLVQNFTSQSLMLALAPTISRICLLTLKSLAPRALLFSGSRNVLSFTNEDIRVRVPRCGRQISSYGLLSALPAPSTFG